MRLQLKRYAYAPGATLGRLVIGDDTYYTIERPWRDNRPFDSCIPQGAYLCRRYSSAKYPDTFEVCDVPGRTHILFHVANWAHDVEGCIGVGLDQMENDFGVTQSRIAFDQFKNALRDVDEFEILVGQYRPEYP